MDDMTGYGSKRGIPADDNDGDEGFAGQPADVEKHPQVNHNGHRKDSPGQCVGCGSARCMGGCGTGCKRM